MKKELTNKQNEVMELLRRAYLKHEVSSNEDYPKRTLNNLISKNYIIIVNDNIELTEKGKDFLGLLPYEVELNKDIVLNAIHEEIALHKRLFNVEDYHPSLTQIIIRLFKKSNGDPMRDIGLIKEKRVNYIIRQLESEKILKKVNCDGFNRYDYQIELL